jgi:Na+-translocating ferredoxin:NAD+ oxidoreductase RnfD subunit
MTQQILARDGRSKAGALEWRRHLSLNNRFVPPLFITIILLVGHLSFGILESYTRTMLAIVTSILAELVLGRIFLRKWPHVASAYITGISIGILIRSPAFWPYVLCSLLAISSKYVLRVRGRHLWNPSNFGICVMLFLASQFVAPLSIQWGNSMLPMVVIWVLGSLIIWRLRRFHISAAYVASFIVLAIVRSWIIGSPWRAEISPITGPEYQLFIFFMITDPKTTVRSWRGQCVVVIFVAIVEMVLRIHQCVFAPLYALFLVGPTAILIEMWLESRKVQGRGEDASISRPSVAVSI